MAKQAWPEGGFLSESGLLSALSFLRVYSLE